MIQNKNIENFNKLKEKVETEYKLLEAVKCPFLHKKINFNAKGLEHIKFKEWNKTRPISDQYLRLKFLKYAPIIVSKSATLQEFNETKGFERVRKNTRWEKNLIPVKYYCFIAIINYTIKVKVIVKEVNGGTPFFWSIIPFWKTKNDPILKLKQIKKVFHEGDLHKD